jgi:hypothetical protein
MAIDAKRCVAFVIDRVSHKREPTQNDGITTTNTRKRWSNHLKEPTKNDWAASFFREFESQLFMWGQIYVYVRAGLPRNSFTEIMPRPFASTIKISAKFQVSMFSYQRGSNGAAA